MAPVTTGKKQKAARIILKVIGIMMVISGVISIGLCVAMVAGSYLHMDFATQATHVRNMTYTVHGDHLVKNFGNHFVLWVIWTYNLILSIMLFRNGFQGFHLVGRPEKSLFLIKKSIIMFGMCSLGIVFGLLSRDWANVSNNMNAFVLNLLYFIGTMLNLKHDVGFHYYLIHPIKTAFDLWYPQRHHWFLKLTFLGVIIAYLAESALCLIFCICLLPVNSGTLHALELSGIDLIVIATNVFASRLVCAALGFLAPIMRSRKMLDISLVITVISILLGLFDAVFDPPVTGLFIGSLLPAIYLLCGVMIKKNFFIKQLPPRPPVMLTQWRALSKRRLSISEKRHH